MENAQKDEQLKGSYILHFILKSSMHAEETDKYRAMVNDKIRAAGGEIEASLCQNSARTLTYPIGKEARGYFCESIFTLEQKNVKELADIFRHEVPIMRYMIERREKKRRPEKARRVRKTPPQQSALLGTPASPEVKREGLSMDEIDKKLDEIIKNI